MTFGFVEFKDEVVKAYNEKEKQCEHVEYHNPKERHVIHKEQCD
jgi:hypothetical protein